MTVRVAALFGIAFIAMSASRAAPVRQEATSQQADAATPCVEVRIGQDRAGHLDCLNRALRAEVDKAAPVAPVDPAAGASADRIGQPTTAAVKQRLGNAYGHSVEPQRPPRVFAPPLPPVH